MFTHTFREGNKIADWMAMQGAISSTHFFFRMNFPQSFLGFVLFQFNLAPLVSDL